MEKSYKMQQRFGIHYSKSWKLGIRYLLIPIPSLGNCKTSVTLIPSYHFLVVPVSLKLSLLYSQQNTLMNNYTAKMSLVPDDSNGGVF
jgi:hypothetical protein